MSWKQLLFVFAGPSGPPMESLAGITKCDAGYGSRFTFSFQCLILGLQQSSEVTLLMFWRRTTCWSQQKYRVWKSGPGPHYQ
ncbi:hypothetical protein FKM82_010103 [Ascaphus truei]